MRGEETQMVETMGLSTARLLQIVVRRSRRRAAHVANRLEVSIKIYEARHDRTYKSWLEETRSAIADGSIDRAEDPAHVVEQWLTRT